MKHGSVNCYKMFPHSHYEYYIYDINQICLGGILKVNKCSHWFERVRKLEGDVSLF